MIDPTPTSTKWVRLHNAFVERQNRAQNRRAILEFMRQMAEQSTISQAEPQETWFSWSHL